MPCINKSSSKQARIRALIKRPPELRFALDSPSALCMSRRAALIHAFTQSCNPLNYHLQTSHDLNLITQALIALIATPIARASPIPNAAAALLLCCGRIISYPGAPFSSSLLGIAVASSNNHVTTYRSRQIKTCLPTLVAS